MAWCEQNRVDYLFGLARNARLVAMIEEELAAARAAAETRRPAAGARRFKDFQWSSSIAGAKSAASSPRRSRREGKDPRFVVTSLKRSEAGAAKAAL